MPWPHRQMGPRHAGIPHPERQRVLLTVYTNLASIHWLLVFARNWTGGRPQILNETPPAGRGKWSAGLQPPTPQKEVLIPPPSLPHSRDRRRCFIRKCLQDKSQDKDSWVGGEEVRDSEITRSPSGGPMGVGQKEGGGAGNGGKGGRVGRRALVRGEFLHLLGHHTPPPRPVEKHLRGSLDWAGVQAGCREGWGSFHSRRQGCSSFFFF